MGPIRETGIRAAALGRRADFARPAGPRRGNRSGARVTAEALEPRRLLSASGTDDPAIGLTAAAAGPAVTTANAPAITTARARRLFKADHDVGSPGRPGRYAYRRGVYTLSGGGADIWGTNDQFNFAAARLTGDGVITARVTGLGDTDPWAKAGVMFRETYDAGARDAYVTVTPRDQVQFLHRDAPDASAAAAGDAAGPAAPVWVKLVRQGDTFTGFWSADGAGWAAVGGPVTVDLPDTAYVGLVASSHDDTTLTTAVFDSVTVTALPPGGVYRLATRGRKQMSLDVEGFRNENGTPVILYRANQTSNQQWLVQGQGDGTFKIYAYSGRNSLQMLDYAAGKTADGTVVQTWEDNGTDAQRWVFVPARKGYWRIVPENATGTLQTLQIAGGKRAGEGARTEIGTYRADPNQMFRLADAGPPLTLSSPKKGLAGWSPERGAAVHPSWFYTWGGDRPPTTPDGVEFVPMVWGYYGNANNGMVDWLNRVKSQPGVQTLLAFNEPDGADQANLSVDAALDGYQYLAATGLPLGSPAAVHPDNGWMRDFMAKAADRGYRVDYVTVHWYGGADPEGFLGYLDYVHNLYGKPLWVTEFAPADWSGRGGVSAGQAYDFMRRVLPELNRREYVQRYSWFSAGPGDAALGQSALFGDDGSVTALGALYARM